VREINETLATNLHGAQKIREILILLDHIFDIVESETGWSDFETGGVALMAKSVKIVVI